MAFWLMAAVIAGLVGLILALAFRGDPVTDEASDVGVYRDQLTEVERDLARGVLSEEEAARARVEVSRRLLEADKAAKGSRQATGGPGTAAALVVALAVIGGSFWAYQRLGAPGYPDIPLKARIDAADEARALRPSQTTAEAAMPALPDPTADADPAFLNLMTKLRTAVADRPDDLQGYELLARNEARLGNWPAVHVAQSRVIGLKGDAATASDHSVLANAMILAAGGYVSPEAEAALTEAMRLNPRDGVARYYSGLLFAQNGRADLAFRLWRSLLDDSQPEDPWVAPLRAQIGDVAAMAGVEYTLPALRGPSEADVAAAGEMSDEDRQSMIRGMVQGLSDRLATEGGPPEDWARLITALGVLGETERAKAIWGEAQTVFAGNSTALDQIAAAAGQAGLNQ